MAHDVAPKSNKNLDRHVEFAPKSIKKFLMESWGTFRQTSIHFHQMGILL